MEWRIPSADRVGRQLGARGEELPLTRLGGEVDAVEEFLHTSEKHTPEKHTSEKHTSEKP